MFSALPESMRLFLSHLVSTRTVFIYLVVATATMSLVEFHSSMSLYTFHHFLHCNLSFVIITVYHFAAKIDPGDSFTHVYNIPCNHAGGTFWWHPHHHGSTHLQVAGGAGGFLIMEDDATLEGLPSWYTDMDELLLFISVKSMISLYITSSEI